MSAHVKLTDAGKDILNEKAWWFASGAAKRVLEAARGLAPVDTGALRESIHISETPNSLYVGSDLPYAMAVELGTLTRTPVGYLRRALDNELHQDK